MKPLYSDTDFDKAKSEDLLPCECSNCNNTFLKRKRVIQRAIRGKGNATGKFCSTSCAQIEKSKSIVFPCSECGSDVKRRESEISQNNTGRSILNGPIYACGSGIKSPYTPCISHHLRRNNGARLLTMPNFPAKNCSPSGSDACQSNLS